MTHCGTFQFDDLLVSCATEIVENGFESKLIPNAIKSWLCEKIVHSLPENVVKELLKGLLESRDIEKSMVYSNSVIKDQTGYGIGIDLQMKIFKNDDLKKVFENRVDLNENSLNKT